MWNLSNSLSILRIFLALPVCWAIWHNYTFLAVSLGIIAMLTDYLDGYFARKLNQVTEAGKILDPLADKIIIISVFIVMTIQELVPLWFTIMVFARDVLILLGGIPLKKRLGYVVSSNQTGKWTVLFISLFIVYKVLGFDYFEDYILAFISAMLVISFVQYLIRGISLWKNAE